MLSSQAECETEELLLFTLLQAKLAQGNERPGSLRPHTLVGSVAGSVAARRVSSRTPKKAFGDTSEH
jgi:hypothetical protein